MMDDLEIDKLKSKLSKAEEVIRCFIFDFDSVTNTEDMDMYDHIKRARDYFNNNN